MPACTWCARDSPILRLDPEGLCRRCAPVIRYDLAHLVPKYRAAWRGYKAATGVDARLEAWRVVHEAAGRLAPYEQAGVLRIEPSPEYTVERFESERVAILRAAVKSDIDKLVLRAIRTTSPRMKAVAAQTARIRLREARYRHDVNLYSGLDARLGHYASLARFKEKLVEGSRAMAAGAHDAARAAYEGALFVLETSTLPPEQVDKYRDMVTTRMIRLERMPARALDDGDVGPVVWIG